jgi:hypothetical protein
MADPGEKPVLIKVVALLKKFTNPCPNPFPQDPRRQKQKMNLFIGFSPSKPNSLTDNLARTLFKATDITLHV